MSKLTGLVPIVVLDDAARAVDLADALVAGGVTAIEVTLRTEAGLAAIAALGGRSDLAVGVGTVFTREQLEASADAGATFAVSPGLDADVVERTLELGLTALPGIATPSELQLALRLGCTEAKVFPISQLGGTGYLSALAGPFPHVRFMPSGGVTADNVAEYLAHPAVDCAGVSWLASRAQIAAGDFDAIRERTATAVAELGLS